MDWMCSNVRLDDFRRQAEAMTSCYCGKHGGFYSRHTVQNFCLKLIPALKLSVIFFDLMFGMCCRHSRHKEGIKQAPYASLHVSAPSTVFELLQFFLLG